MELHIQITTTEQDVKDILLHYNLGELVSYKNLSFGYANENFKVSTTKKDVLFRLCKQQTKENIEKEILLMKELEHLHFPTSYPIIDNNGNYIHRLHNHSCLIYQFIEGEHPELNRSTAGEIGKAAGILSMLAVKDSYKKLNAISIENCLGIIREFPQAKFQYPEIYEYFEEHTNFLKSYISQELPKGIVHGDYFPDNTIFRGSELKAIIDFEEFAYDTLLFDLGMAINGFCFKENVLQVDLIQAIIHEYNKLRKLTQKENELLPYYIQWAAHGILYWHLRNNMLYELNETQVKRVEELMNRVKKLRKEAVKWN